MIELKTNTMTEEQREMFIEGWKDAGGYMGDADGYNPYPWCAPWEYDETITVTGDDAADWGRQYWLQVRAEVEAEAEEE